jgi:uncharacterized cysteine cluster protein YcgN (CxxCxxCC family)
MSNEDLCDRCGRCCYHQTLNEPCPYLKENLCSVYDHRFEVIWHDSRGGSHKCFTIKEAIRKGSLPEDCPYRRKNESAKTLGVLGFNSQRDIT